MPRGDSWRAGEDESLAKAWVSVSECPITGADQKAEAFWSKIFEVFRKFEQERTGESTARTSTSLKSRWNNCLRKECSRFAGFHSRVKSINPSGASKEDILQHACNLYCGFDNETAKKCEVKPFFPHMAAYNILKKCPKWKGGGNLGSSTRLKYSARSLQLSVSEETENEEPTGSHASSKDGEGSERKRPMGRKAGKRLKEKESREAKKIRLLEEIRDTSNERTKAIRRHTDFLLVQRPGFDPTLASAFYKDAEEELRERLEESKNRRERRRKRNSSSSEEICTEE